MGNANYFLFIILDILQERLLLDPWLGAWPTTGNGLRAISLFIVCKHTQNKFYVQERKKHKVREEMQVPWSSALHQIYISDIQI